MSVLWVMFWWASGIAVVAWVVDYVLVRFEKLPEFVTNEEQGVTALCSVWDFKNGSYEKKFTVVPEIVTVSLYRDGMSDQLFKHISGYSARQEFGLQKTKESRRLFIPFLSENVMTYSEQGEKFISPQKLGEFIRRKKAEVISHDWRMRLAEKVTPYKSWIIIGERVSAVVTALIMVVIVGVQLVEDSEQRDKEVIYSYSTKVDGSVLTSEATGGTRYLLETDVRSPIVLLSGKVSSINPLGGGISNVCLGKSSVANDTAVKYVCGRSALNVEIGDVAYLRVLGVKTVFIKSDSKIVPYSADFVPVYIILTKVEAEALAKQANVVIKDL